MSRIIWLLIETVGGLLAVACILRAYAHRVHLSPRNPICQFINAVTDWLVLPLRRLVAPTRSMDWASVVAAVIVAGVVALLYFLISGAGRAPGPFEVILGAVFWLLNRTIYLIIGLVIVQAILSWVNPFAPLAPAIQQLTQPLLAPIRKIIPAGADPAAADPLEHPRSSGAHRLVSLTAEPSTELACELWVCCSGPRRNPGKPC
jgi:YggT family protein